MADSFNELFGLGSHSEDANLEGWWPYQDDAANTTVVDESSNGRDGTASANTNVLSTTGPNSWLPAAFSFNGSSQRISLPAAAFASGTAERHYHFFFKADSFGTGGVDQPMLDAGGSAGGRPGEGWIVSAEDDAVSLVSFSHRVITPKSTLSAGTWYSVGTRCPSGATTTAHPDILIDGTDQTLSDEAGSAQTLDTVLQANQWQSFEENQDNYFGGDIAHLSVWSRALTDAEDAEITAGPELINSVAPVLSGTEAVNETLSVTTGTWVLAAPFAAGSNGSQSFEYQWTRSDDDTGTNEADISGATSNAYTLVAADEGKNVRCRVRGVNAGGFDAAADTNSNMSGTIAGGGGGGGVPTKQKYYHQMRAA